MENTLLKLQNGSDIRGIAIAHGDTVATLTPEVTAAIGAAFVIYIKNKLNKNSVRIAIGNDSRISAKALFDYFCVGAVSQGACVTYTALSSTPAMFMSTIMPDFEYDAGVMITASHLPYDRNGFKFFTREGGFEKSDIKAILTLANEIEFTPTAPRYEERDIMTAYSAELRNVIISKAGIGDRPLEGIHIVTDAGNGAGGFFAEQVLKPLGANTCGSVFSEPDGTFPNHAPNPEDTNAMTVFSKAVLDVKADMGIIFDTDVDRSAIVLSDGREINRNRLIALMTAIVLQDHEKPVIVTDSVTSTGLAAFIEEHGAIHRRFKRGYRNVINEAIRLCNEGMDACLAIETSGHGAMRENYFLDDGAYMAALITAQLAKAGQGGLEALISDLKEPIESEELRISITDANFTECAARVLANLEKRIAELTGFSLAPNNFEGVRVNVDKEHGDGWFLLRMSLHDPVLPLNLESNSSGGIALMREWLMSFLREQEGLVI